MTRSLLLRAGTLLATAAVAVPLAACGSSSSGGDGSADPAKYLPATAPIYLEARVNPEGDLRDNAKAVAKKILDTDNPAQKLTALIDQGLADRGAEYKTDIEPWLGDRIGLAVTSFGGGTNGKGQGVAAIASKDDARARDFVNGRRDTEKRTYKNVEYRYDKEKDTAAAVVENAVLVGSEAGLKSAIDATGGDNLADAKAFQEARDKVSTDGLGFAYMNPGQLFDMALSQGSLAGAQQAQTFKGLIGGSGLRSIAASLQVEQNALRIDAAVIGVKGGKGSGDGPGAAAGVPADAWLSVGVGDVGKLVRSSIDQLGKSGAIPGVDPATLLQQLKSSLGVDVEQDLLSWMGDAALFIRGRSVDTLDGALVVQSTDPARSQRAIGVLRRLLPRLNAPVERLRVDGGAGLKVPLGKSGREVEIAAKDDKFVIALGHAALTDALAGGDTLGDSAAYKTASGVLGGDKPNLFFDTPQVVGLIGAAVQGQEAAKKFAEAQKTLDAFGPGAASWKSDGDVMRLKAAVEVK